MRHFRIAQVLFLITVLSTASEAFAGNLVVDGTLVSTVPSGTPPLAVTSTSPVANLNADMVDGMDAADFATGSELAVLLDNVSLSNDGFGVELGGAAAYGRNLIEGNDLGARTGTGLQVDVNLCSIGDPCP